LYRLNELNDDDYCRLLRQQLNSRQLVRDKKLGCRWRAARCCICQ